MRRVKEKPAGSGPEISVLFNKPAITRMARVKVYDI